MVLALVTMGLMLPGLASTASAQDPASLCSEADAVGAGAVVAGYDVVSPTGGSGSQIVLGYGGSTLSGGSGNDILCAWGTGNILDGGSGNDLLVAMDSPGNAFYGGSGNDTMIGYTGDSYDGGSGSNSWTGAPNMWVIDAGGGYFYIQGAGFSPLAAITTLVEGYGDREAPYYVNSTSNVYSTDPRGNFTTGTFFPYYGCSFTLIDPAADIEYTIVTVTEDSTGFSLEQTFTRDQTCFE